MIIKNDKQIDQISCLPTAAAERGAGSGILFTEKHPLARLYVDMDGTLTEFQNVDKETLYAPGYFRNLKPNVIALNGLKEFLETFNDDKRFEVYILSNYLTDRENSREEKEEWLKVNAPWLEEHNCKVIFNPCGTSKRSAVREFLPKTNPVVNILLDDHTPNLIDFCGYSKGEKYLNTNNAIFGNEGIKLINGVNDRTRWWRSGKATRCIWANQDAIHTGDMYSKEFAFTLYWVIMDILTEYIAIPCDIIPLLAQEDFDIECYKWSLSEIRHSLHRDAIATIRQSKIELDPKTYRSQVARYKNFDKLATLLLAEKLKFNKRVEQVVNEVDCNCEMQGRGSLVKCIMFAIEDGEKGGC